MHLDKGRGRLRALWSLVAAVADDLSSDGLEVKTSGIWELREPADLVSADIGIWIALDRAVRIARWRPWRAESLATGPRRRPGPVRAALLPDGGLPQVYRDGHAADASALLAVMFGLLEGEEAGRLVDATLRKLDAAPFLYRYEPGGDDGFGGVEGAFLPCSWWVVSALAACGRYPEAVERARRLDGSLPALLPEEMDPERRSGLGNAPLVWSHMEAARAAYLLDAAELRQRLGTPALLAWRGQRWLRSQWR